MHILINKKLPFLMGIAIIITSLIAISPVFASVIMYSSIEPKINESVDEFSVNETPVNSTLQLYWVNLTPKNDIYGKKVMPGYTIALGRVYDLTYVSGVSKKYAWWKDYKVQGSNCYPDVIVNTSYVETNGKINPKSVYLDPQIWKVGDWYQWDGCYQLPYNKNHPEAQYVPYMRDNNLAFKIINDPNPPDQKIVYEFCTNQTGNQTINDVSRWGIQFMDQFTGEYLGEPKWTACIAPAPTKEIPTKEITVIVTMAQEPVKEEEGWPLWYYPIGILIAFIVYRLFW